MFNFLFGKKRVQKNKSNKKPPKKLLKICKSLKVKTYSTSKGKKVYKSVKSLKKSCLKIVNKLIKHKFGAVKKIPKELIKKCKKARVKLTVSRNGKRVRKSVKSLINQCKKKNSKVGKCSTRTYKVRMNRFGQYSLVNASYDVDPHNYGYSQKENNIVGIKSQKPTETGVFKDFFGDSIPEAYPPEWYQLRQQDGSLVEAGYPHNLYAE